MTVYWVIPQGIVRNIAPNRILFITIQTGGIAPEGKRRCRMSIPENYLESEVSADVADIVSTLIIINWLSKLVAVMDSEYVDVCKHPTARQKALKDYIGINQHPEWHLIWRAINQN